MTRGKTCKANPTTREPEHPTHQKHLPAHPIHPKTSTHVDKNQAKTPTKKPPDKHENPAHHTVPGKQARVFNSHGAAQPRYARNTQPTGSGTTPTPPPADAADTPLSTRNNTAHTGLPSARATRDVTELLHAITAAASRRATHSSASTPSGAYSPNESTTEASPLRRLAASAARSPSLNPFRRSRSVSVTN